MSTGTCALSAAVCSLQPVSHLVVVTSVYSHQKVLETLVNEKIHLPQATAASQGRLFLVCSQWHSASCSWSERLRCRAGLASRVTFPRKGHECDCNSPTAIVVSGRGRVPMEPYLQKGTAALSSGRSRLALMGDSDWLRWRVEQVCRSPAPRASLLSSPWGPPEHRAPRCGRATIVWDPSSRAVSCLPQPGQGEAEVSAMEAECSPYSVGPGQGCPSGWGGRRGQGVVMGAAGVPVHLSRLISVSSPVPV